MKKVLSFIYLLIIICSNLQCNKRGFLNENPTSDLHPVSGLNDLQAILDNSEMNYTVALSEISGDDIYIPFDRWQSLNGWEKNAYIWAPAIFQQNEIVQDWLISYKQIFNANFALQELSLFPVTDNNVKSWNKIKGEAYFKRAFALFNLAQVFTIAYDDQTASTDPGLPLPLSPTPELPSTRSTIKKTYEQIISDLQVSRQLLPNFVDPPYRTQPTRPAVLAMLARVYLSMGRYAASLLYADSCLRIYDKLLDYNQVNLLAAVPFDIANAEVLYRSRVHDASDILIGLSSNGCAADSALYSSYEQTDLRRNAYYFINWDGLPHIKGSYSGNFRPFVGGLATDEVYLMRAECYARTGKSEAALADLNMLLEKRWKTGTYVPFTSRSSIEAIDLILAERRKELAFRGLRWTDLKRINKQKATTTLRRVLDNRLFELLPNDKRYALPIPPNVVIMSGMQQNPR